MLNYEIQNLMEYAGTGKYVQFVQAVGEFRDVIGVAPRLEIDTFQDHQLCICFRCIFDGRDWTALP